jgi:hypothetical protein
MIHKFFKITKTKYPQGYGSCTGVYIMLMGAVLTRKCRFNKALQFRADQINNVKIYFWPAVS